MDKTRIKIAEGVNIITDEGIQFCPAPTDIWNAFGWDIENDPNARECATLITQHLLCFHEMDLSSMYGHKLKLELVPVKEDKTNYDLEGGDD